VGHGRMESVDPGEPKAVAEALATLNIRHAVLTSVTRDDLPDGGAGHWAAVIEEIRQVCPDTSIEVLVPDFKACPDALETVFAARPDVFGHNIETVRRLSPSIRPQADYDRTLKVLDAAHRAGMITKSGIMVGLGETDEEILDALGDLRRVGAQIVTIGQYLQPSRKQVPVDRYVTPEQFEQFHGLAMRMGFDHVESAPLVRSSYHADRGLSACRARRGAEDEPSSAAS